MKESEEFVGRRSCERQHDSLPTDQTFCPRIVAKMWRWGCVEHLYWIAPHKITFCRGWHTHTHVVLQKIALSYCCNRSIANSPNAALSGCPTCKFIKLRLKNWKPEVGDGYVAPWFWPHFDARKNVVIYCYSWTARVLNPGQYVGSFKIFYLIMFLYRVEILQTLTLSGVNKWYTIKI